MTAVCTSSCYSDVLSLMNQIEENSNYSLTLYPNFGSSEPIVVLVSFVLVKLMELMNSGTFAVAGTLITIWYDSNLAWSPSAHNNVSRIAMPSVSVWKPNLLLINAVSKGPINADVTSFSTVDYDGKVTTVLPKIFNATCPIDMTYFPFDTQQCTLTIGNTDFSHRASQAIHFAPYLQAVDAELFIAGGEFAYVGSNITTGFYNLVKVNFMFPIVNVTVIFKRNPVYYLINVAIPCVILLISSGLIFFLPSDNTIKIAMACSLLMALYVLQQAISRVLPTTPIMPLLATGIMIELGLGCYSVLCAVVTVTLRAVQPPLCPCCVKLIKAVERALFCVNNKTTLVQATEARAMVVTQARSTSIARSHRLAASVATLVQTMKTQAERNEAKKLEQAEHLRHWKVLDFALNMLLFLLYLLVALVSGVKFLFGLGV